VLHREIAGSEIVSAADERRRRILEAARACFARSGFHGASMQEICAAAKMSPGALYRYFPSKEAIIEAIADEERLCAVQIVREIEGEGLLLDRLIDCAMAYLDYARQPETSELFAEINAESLRNTDIGRRFKAIDEEARLFLRAALADAAARGEIGRDIDLDAALGVLMAACDGLVQRQIFDPHLTSGRVRPVLRRIIAAALETPDRG